MTTTRKQRRKLLAHAKTIANFNEKELSGVMLQNLQALQRGAKKLIDCNATDPIAVDIYLEQLKQLEAVFKQLGESF